MQELTLWDFSNVISKLLIYTGVASAIGGPFIAMLINPSLNKKAIINYITLTSFVGIIAVLGNFFIKVGAFSEAGLFGMFDPDMFNFLWDSAIGDAVWWRLLGFIALAGALFFGNLNIRYEAFSFKHVIFIGLYIVAIFCFTYSFTFIGHSADIGGIAKWLIAFHILTMAWWVGALYPLWLSCKLLSASALYKLMNLFGQIAMVMVGLLIACGVSLLFLFFTTPMELLTTTYGQAILLKLVFVGGILLIAAYHKFHLVEALKKESVCLKLQNSIKNEMKVGFCIILITGILSSVLGPS